MDDDEDLDELLDEVEEKFCRNVSVAASAREGEEGEEGEAGGARRPSARKPEEARRSISEDIDALLEELEEEERGCRQPKREKCPEEPAVGQKRSSAGRKCCPVFVGGCSVTSGVGTATSKRSCDQLRCVSCDFRVLMFDDCEWDSSCDYLFLRNNVPDRQKLRAKLKKRTGFRAYACQCSWFSCSSSSGPTDLRVQPQLRWVCGKHPD